MIALDTNVLVRFLLRDDEKQAQAAAKAIGRCTPQEPALITREVCVELFWVLERTQRLPRKTVVELFAGLLGAGRVVFEESGRVAQALQGTVERGLDFADQMIAESAKAAGASHTLTFDRKAAKISGMKQL